MKGHLVPILLVALAAPGCGGHGTYSIGGGMTTGSAMLPATASPRTFYHLRYTEIGGGIITRTLLLLGSVPEGRTESFVSTDCERGPGGGIKARQDHSCTVRSVTYRYPPSEEEVAKWLPTARTILEDSLPIVLDLAAYFDLGNTDGEEGGTSGYEAGIYYRTPVAMGKRGRQMVQVDIGFRVQKLDFHQVAFDWIEEGTSGELNRVPTSDNVRFLFAGFPVRVSWMAARWCQPYLEYGWNFASIVGTSYNKQHGSPLRLGINLMIPGFEHVYGSAELISDGNDISRNSIMSEVNFAW